jgi:hypothetical protein
MSWTCPDQCKAKITTCWTYDQGLGLYEQLALKPCIHCVCVCVCVCVQPGIRTARVGGAKMQLVCCRAWLMAALVLHFCCIGEGVEPQTPALIVFGDSTVDVGMNNFMPTLVKSDFAPYGESFEGGKPTGRFTNGLMVNDFLGNLGSLLLQLIELFALFVFSFLRRGGS